MAKRGHRRNKKNKETGKRKPRESAEQNQKQRQKEHDRMTTFKKKKEEEQALQDMMARETALKQLGIEDRFEFADHAKIYNAEHGKFHCAPIEMVDASVPTGQWRPQYSSLFSESARRYFQRVRAEELAQAGWENDGLRLRRAKAVLAGALRRRK